MSRILHRVARIIAAPGAEWAAIANERTRTSELLWRFILPLSLIPGTACAIGLWLAKEESRASRNAAIAGIDQGISGGLVTAIGGVLWILLSAVSLRLVVRLFDGVRDWVLALQVAAYSATPMLLAGVLLIQPDLVAVLVVAFFHSLYLQFLGVQRVLQVKETHAAEFVALSTLLLSVLLTVAGSLGSSLGVL